MSAAGKARGDAKGVSAAGKGRAGQKLSGKPKTAKAKAPVFEWGGGRFVDRAGLEDLLARGYFREGPAWGALRCGWEQAASWEQVWGWLAEASRSRMIACSGAMAGAAASKRAPVALALGAGGPGHELWAAAFAGGFAAAAGPMWAACEAWSVGGSAREPASAGGGKKGRL